MKKLLTMATMAVILLVTSTVVFAATGGLVTAIIINGEHVQIPQQAQAVTAQTTSNKWHSDIMNDVDVTYEMARQIAIDYAGIAKPDVANLRSIMNRNSDNPIWNFTVAGAGLMISVQIDSDTGEIVRSQHFDGVWSAENFPVSFDEAVRIAIDHVNIATSFIAYFHGHTTLPNGNQFWRVHIDSHSGVYDVHIDVFTGEVIRFLGDNFGCLLK